LVLLLEYLEVLVNVTNEYVVLIYVNKSSHILNDVRLCWSWLVDHVFIVANAWVLLGLVMGIELHSINYNFKILFPFLNRNQFASILANTANQALLVIKL
jgi:hypothetical protein